MWWTCPAYIWAQCLYMLVVHCFCFKKMFQRYKSRYVFRHRFEYIWNSYVLKWENSTFSAYICRNFNRPLARPIISSMIDTKVRTVNTTSNKMKRVNVGTGETPYDLLKKSSTLTSENLSQFEHDWSIIYAEHIKKVIRLMHFESHLKSLLKQTSTS